MTIIKKPTQKNWLYVSVAAAALMLGACADKEPVATEEETTIDAQTTVEQEAIAEDTDDVAVASADESMVVGDNDEVAVATADDSEVLDGSESEEHVSTY
ncbi:hypothetical protein J3492_03920 [Psychrobacter sp. F1192]|uniref:Lipoprotein n=1 Tax=Psychrobacter coccoides TaxID=2818440 RepID=A0ABS3NLR9_9GAMM|nr:hypothetical protein [Psychrobacter coccoides]MBO1530359.1 hypothetical protein [Psychrobacter coccoides]